jgi:ABC-type multidrug transport system fused ATPase/permease subunit
MFIVRLWKIFPPQLKRDAKKYLVISFLYQLVQVIESYTLSLIIYMARHEVGTEVWAAFFSGYVGYALFFTRLDNRLDYLNVRMEYQLKVFLSSEVFKKLLELDIPFFKGIQTGALASMLQRGNGGANEFYRALTWQMIGALIQLVLSVAAMCIFSWVTAPIVVVSYVVFIWLGYKSVIAREAQRKARYDAEEQLSEMQVSTIQLIAKIKTYVQEDNVLQKFLKLLDGYASNALAEFRKNIYVYQAPRIFINIVARIIMWALWVYLMQHGWFEIEGLVYLFTLSEKAYRTIWNLDWVVESGIEASESVGRLLDLLETPRTYIFNGVEYSDNKDVGIQFKGVGFSYNGGSGKGELQNLTVDIEPGSIVGIAGHSGAGKSTMIDLMRGFYYPTSGQVIVNGIDIRNWDVRKLRGLFAFVDQQHGILSATIRDNIAFSDPGATMERIIEAAHIAGIADFIESLPDGYETPVGERGITLSGGQIQRLEIARAVLPQARVLIFDEATSNLDPAIEGWIQDQISQILTGRTAIMIAHRLSTIWDIADKILVLHEGRLVEEGNHQELMSLNGVYAEMVRLQTHS